MKLRVLLKWGVFNKRGRFERAAEEILQWDIFTQDKVSWKFNKNLMKSPKYGARNVINMLIKLVILLLKLPNLSVL
jgi:hypothetical protein